MPNISISKSSLHNTSLPCFSLTTKVAGGILNFYHELHTFIVAQARSKGFDFIIQILIFDTFVAIVPYILCNKPIISFI